MCTLSCTIIQPLFFYVSAFYSHVILWVYASNNKWKYVKSLSYSLSHNTIQEWGKRSLLGEICTSNTTHEQSHRTCIMLTVVQTSRDWACLCTLYSLYLLLLLATTTTTTASAKETSTGGECGSRWVYRPDLTHNCASVLCSPRDTGLDINGCERWLQSSFPLHIFQQQHAGELLALQTISWPF